MSPATPAGRILAAGLFACLFIEPAAGARTPSIEISVVEPRPLCLPFDEHALLEATVLQCPAPGSASCSEQERVPYDVGGHEVRLYFRRLSADPEGEFFYFVEMNRRGGGVFWTTFPIPEDRPQTELTECWWRVRKNRDPTSCPAPEPERVREARGRLPKTRAHDWLGSCGLEELEDWLEVWFAAALEDTGADEARSPERCAEGLDDEPPAASRRSVAERQEAAEYYVAIFDADGEPLTDDRGEPVRSDVRLIAVREDCLSGLNVLERGWADNLTVGETSEDQRGDERKGKELFHWRCDGVTSRIDVEGVPRPDEHCRRCVIGRFAPPSGGGSIGPAQGAGREPPPLSPAALSK